MIIFVKSCENCEIMSKIRFFRGVLNSEWSGLPMVSRVLWCWYLHQVMVTCWKEKGGKAGFRSWLEGIGGKVEVEDMSYTTFPSGYNMSASVWYHRMAELKKAGVVGDGWLLYPSEFVDAGFFELEMVGDTVLSRFGVASVLYSMLYRAAEYRGVSMIRINTKVFSNSLGISQEMCWKYMRFLEDKGCISKRFIPRYGTYTCITALEKQYGTCIPDTDQPLRRFRVKTDNSGVKGDDEGAWGDPAPAAPMPKVKSSRKSARVEKPRVEFDFGDDGLPF